MTDNIDPLRVLRKRLAEVSQPIGLELREMDVRVSEGGTDDLVVALFTIDMEEIGRTQEEAQVDAQFKELEQGFLEQQREERAAEAISNLKKMGLIYRRKEE